MPIPDTWRDVRSRPGSGDRCGRGGPVPRRGGDSVWRSGYGGPPWLPGLVGFIDELAREWRGWDGVKDCHSLEGHLSLSATADRLGHVSVEARIQADPLGEQWIATALLQLEAGSSTDRLARQFRTFFQSGSTGT